MFTYITTNHYSPKSLIIYKQVDITQYDSTSIQRIPNAFKVQQITNSSHPALNQFGLFAKRGIPPRTHILNYIGHVHTEEESQPDSNYDIRFIFTPQGSLHIDASKMGNEARFINDYRGNWNMNV